MPVHQGNVQGFQFPVTQRAASDGRGKPRRRCKVCGGEIPETRHWAAKTCCEECGKENYRRHHYKAVKKYNHSWKIAALRERKRNERKRK